MKVHLKKYDLCEVTKAKIGLAMYLMRVNGVDVMDIHIYLDNYLDNKNR